MDKTRTSFSLRCDLIHDVRPLSNSDAGVLFKAIFEYVNHTPTEVPDNLQPLYQKIVAQIEASWATFNPTTQRYHWNYKGGVTSENKKDRSSGLMIWWRNEVFARDKYTCQKCLIKGGELNAHHVKPFAAHKELRFELSNGLTLCKSCHKKAHAKNG